MFGPDVSSSLTIDELKKLVEGTRYIEAVVENSVDKNSIAEELKPVRNIFTKSIVYRRDLEKGTIIKRDDISFKKPGTGVDPTHLEKVIGKQLKRSVKGDDQLSMSDLI
tara:strand:- start:261 stop:587 length:327 start_codon:yes stop_codon:yes gene_type:complete